MSTLLIAANLPDIDMVFGTTPHRVAVHRGWTHGLTGQLLLPFVLAGLMLVWHRLGPRRPDAAAPRLWPLALLAYVGVLSHQFLDFLNSYGIRLLLPFSDRWLYGDALYIVDPWMYLALGAGVCWSYQRAWRIAGSHPASSVRSSPDSPARLALLLAGAYALVMLVSNLAARGVVSEGLRRAGLPADTRFMVTPVLVNPFRREVVFEVGDRYERGTVWFRPLPHFRPDGFGIDTNLHDHEIGAAIDGPRARAYLHWSRFPFAALDTSTKPAGVWLNDYRYASRGAAGWAATYLRPHD